MPAAARQRLFVSVVSTPVVLRSKAVDVWVVFWSIAGTPKMPDTNSNLIWMLDPASLSALANGAIVSTWIADGTAPTVNRIYNFAYSGWGFPTISKTGGPGGAPAVMFNGGQQICNGAGTTAVNQPSTYALVAKAGMFATSQARLLASGSQIIAPGYAGWYASGGTRLELGNISTDWEVIIVVFNGDSSKIKVNDGAIINGSTGAVGVPSGRNCLGGQGGH